MRAVVRRRPAKGLCARWLALAGVAVLSGAAPAARSVSLPPVGFRSVHSTLPGRDDMDEARRLVRQERWEQAREKLAALVEALPEDPERHELYADVLAELDRLDEAAHHYDQALKLRIDEGASRTVRALQRKLGEVDPLEKKRRAFFNKARDLLVKSGEDLLEAGDLKRGLEILERVLPLLGGRERERIDERIEDARAKQTEIDLDSTAGGQRELVEFESEHYHLRCWMEPEAVSLVAETMDAIYLYYVEIYLDGDLATAETFPKVTLFVHPTWERMAHHYPGGTAPAGLGGWWSPSENTVHCYDTKARTGSRDWLLHTLFHEASHQFMTILVQRGEKGWAPAWLNEGTSCFFEGARALADHSVLWPDASVQRLQELVPMLESGGGPTVEQVIGFSQPGSYPGPFYPFGWGLVYYLMGYEDPATLEHPYRPLYTVYRDRILTEGGDSRKLFDEVFLGPRSPRGQRSLEEFARDWRRWILEEVKPLHLGSARRAKRKEKAAQYLAAAQRVGDSDPAKRERFLDRALGHLEYIRTELDLDESPDPEVLRQEIDILEALDRPRAESVIIEQLLDLADDGRCDLPAAEYEALSRRLRRIDRKNAELRATRARIKNRVEYAYEVLQQYEEAERPYLLRAYTFAAEAGTLLADEGLLSRAAQLQRRAAQAGLLTGSLQRWNADATRWATIFAGNAEASFSVSPVAITLESNGGKYAGRINLDVELSGEYELRTTLERVDDVEFGDYHGIVFSGTEEGEWLCLGVDYEGHVVIESVTAGTGTPRHEKWEEIELERPIAPDEPIELRVHVWPEGNLEVQISDREPLEIELPVEMPLRAHPGVIVKGGRVVANDPVLENFL